MRSFKEFYLFREEEQNQQLQNGDWKKNFIQLEKGFIPPSKMRPIVEAFLKSNEIKIMSDTTKEVTMPRKALYLTGGSVRDFLKNKTIRNYHLCTDATPEQVGTILNAAGFDLDGDHAPMNLPVTPKKKEMGSNRTWSVKHRDGKNTPYTITASVDGENFDIETFRKNPKTDAVPASVEFANNPHEDSAKRDFTMNAMYIELSKPDGENTKLYDPSKKGYHDANHGIVRTNGDPEERFKEDKSRALRAVRLHARYGKGPMPDEISKIMPKFKNLDGIPYSNVREEFLKGLMHPDVDVKKYLNMYKSHGLLEKVFPGIKFESPNGIPLEFTDKKDKPLALAWLLQHNPIEKVQKVLAQVSPNKDGDFEHTGWTSEERRAVIFLLRLKEYTPKNDAAFDELRKESGLTNDQIRDWVDMFNIGDTNRNRRPWWAKQVKSFVDK